MTRNEDSSVKQLQRIADSLEGIDDSLRRIAEALEPDEESVCCDGEKKYTGDKNLRGVLVSTLGLIANKV